jgi:hypothetical protein
MPDAGVKPRVRAALLHSKEAAASATFSGRPANRRTGTYERCQEIVRSDGGHLAGGRAGDRRRFRGQRTGGASRASGGRRHGGGQAADHRVERVPRANRSNQPCQCCCARHGLSGEARLCRRRGGEDRRSSLRAGARAVRGRFRPRRHRSTCHRSISTIPRSVLQSMARLAARR